MSTVANVTETSASNDTATVANALGIINSTAEVRGAVNESGSDTRHGANNVTRVSMVNASYEFSSNSTVAFTPALGVLPTGAVVAGNSWVSTAVYQASADWDAHWLVNLTGPRGKSIVAPGSIEINVPGAAGSVTLIGRASESGVHIHATRLLAIGYDLGSHFVLGPGLAVSWAVPGAFGEGLPSSSTWASDAVVGANVQVSSLDAAPGAGLATRVQSSDVSFSLRVLDPNNGNGVNDTVPQSEVAGAPLTPSQASSTASCLQQAGACSTSTGLGSGGGLGGNGTVLLVVGSVVILAVLVAAVLVTRQRRIPPPQYPNARLYPPGQPVSPPRTNPAQPKAPTAPPSGPSDDPLDQLW